MTVGQGMGQGGHWKDALGAIADDANERFGGFGAALYSSGFDGGAYAWSWRLPTEDVVEEVALRAAAGDDHRSAGGLRARGDREAQRAIADVLQQARPADAVLSEEAVDEPSRLGAQRVWIVDPLDGTREYGEAGRSDWAVHVALWQRTDGERGDLGAAAVALPARGLVLTTARPAGTAQPVAPLPRTGPVRLAVSRTRASAAVLALAEALGAELVPMGSAGVKAASVVLGETDAYVHSGGQYEWDSAAPVAVARAAGLHTSRFDGSALVYNRPDPLLPDLVVCRPELAGDVLAGLERLRPPALSERA